MDRTKLAVLEMLGAQEPTPRHLLRRLEKLRSIIQNHENPPGCRFLLSTIHSAKGLEYDRVILLDVLDGILPAKPELCCRTPGETQQYEEDRRLFYVAMTRARQQLVLFDCAAERSTSFQPSRRSRSGKNFSAFPSAFTRVTYASSHESISSL